MVTVVPATVTVPVLTCAVSLAATVSVTEAAPVPLAGRTVTHEAFEEAVQEQPPSVVTATFCVPPLLAIEALVGDAEKVHDAPACVTVIDRPATVTVPVRLEVVVLAATVRVTDPPPLPFVVERVIHPALDDAVQAQPAVVETLIVCVPPPPAIEALVGDTV